MSDHLPGSTTATADALRLELLFGRAVLTATDIELGPWARMSEFRGEIPGRRYPFDLGTEPERFRNTRAIATSLGIDIDGARLRRCVTTAARTASEVTDVDIALLEDELRVSIELANGQDATTGVVIGRFALVPDVTGGAELDLVMFDHLELGSLPQCGPVIIANALGAVLQSPEFAPLVGGFKPQTSRDTLRIAASRLCLAEAFVHRRWKMPGAEQLRWTRVSIAPGRASLRAAAHGQDHDAPTGGVAQGVRAQEALASQEARAMAAKAEDALFSGDLDTAIPTYRALVERFGSQRFLRARFFSALLAEGSPISAHEVRETARRVLQADPEDAHALAALTTVAERMGEVDEALQAAGRLAESLGRTGRGDDRVDALLFAARVGATRSAQDATTWVDRALRLAPRSPAVLRHRVRLARATGDADAYEDGLSRLLSLARSRSTRARLHRELGRIARDARRDFEAARVHLQQAAELSNNDPSVVLEVAETSAAAGRHVDAIRAFRDAARRFQPNSPQRASEAFLRAAEIWETALEDPANAMVDVEHAANASPDHWATAVIAVRLAVAARDDGGTLRAIDHALALLDANDPSQRDGLRTVLDQAIRFDERRGQSDSAAVRRRQLRNLGETTEAPLRSSDAFRPPAPDIAPHTLPETEAEPPTPTPAPVALAPPAPEPVRDAEEIHARLAEARASGDPNALVSVLPDVAEITTAPAQRARLLSELGQLLYYEIEAPSQALQYLEEAERLDPDGAGADYALLSALEAIYEDTASAEGLMTVYRRKLAQAAGDEIRNVYRLLMAGVLVDQLGQPDEALTLLAEVLESDPRSIPALRLRAKIWHAQGRHEDAATGMQALINMREVDPFERQELLRELGRIEWHALDRLDDAASRFESLLGEIPGDTDCISSLKQIYAKGAAWDRYLDVLRRELGILAGTPSKFTDIDEAGRAAIDTIPGPLRDTYGKILNEAAEVVRSRLSDPARALAMLNQAASFAPADMFIQETRLRTSEAAGDDASFMSAAIQLIPQMLNPETRDALLVKARAAADRLGRRPELSLALAKAGIQAKRETPPADEAAPAPRKSARDDVQTRLERLDGLADAGKHTEAIRAIDTWLPAARRPALRRELLLRKGRWLLDRGGDSRGAMLPLKGALILAPDAPETRLELLRASCRLGDVGQANDQLREYLDNSGERAVDDSELHRLRCAIDDLTAMPSGPDNRRVEDQIRKRAPQLAAQLDLADK